jgi:hypothetical protein
MKAKLVLLVVVLLVVAMIPALAMAKSQAKPEKTGQFVLDRSKPALPQTGLTLKSGAPAVSASAPAALGIQPRAVLGLLNESFEGTWPAGDWAVYDFGASGAQWGAAAFQPRRGRMAAWVAADGPNGVDPNVNPFYLPGMDTWMDYPMDLTNARRATVRFQFKNDAEFGYDAFAWCASADYGGNFYCTYHTGSTNNTWRLVNMNLNNVPGYGSMLGEPGVIVTWGFMSDLSYEFRGAIVDVVRIRATGPAN